MAGSRNNVSAELQHAHRMGLEKMKNRPDDLLARQHDRASRDSTDVLLLSRLLPAAVLLIAVVELLRQEILHAFVDNHSKRERERETLILP
jgi:hypothetical protein